VRIENTLSFNEHVDSVCKSSHFHLRALCHIRKHISADTAKMIACSMVDGRLDYCNSVLYGTSAMYLNELQQVQNSAARIVTGSRRFEHALSLLAELHWLPIKHRIQYKIAVIAFKVLTTQQPSYLANIIRLRAALCQLRSCGRNLLHDDRTNLTFADRVFSHAAPAVWNSLPLDIVSDLSCHATFKRLVKTELYNRAYLR